MGRFTNPGHSAVRDETGIGAARRYLSANPVVLDAVDAMGGLAEFRAGVYRYCG